MVRLRGLLLVLCSLLAAFLAASLAAQVSASPEQLSGSLSQELLKNVGEAADAQQKQTAADALFTVSLDKRLDGGQVHYRLSVEAAPRVHSERTSVVAHVRNSEGFTGLQPLPRVGNNHWQLDYRPEQRARYAIQLHVRGQYQDQGSFSKILPTHYFVYPDIDDPDIDPELDALHAYYQEQLAAAERRAVERQEARLQVLSDPLDGGEETTALLEPEAQTHLSPTSPQRSWPIYLSVALVNLLLLGVAVVVYWRVMRSPGEVLPDEPEPVAQEIPEPAMAMQDISTDEKRPPEPVSDVETEAQPVEQVFFDDMQDPESLFPLDVDDSEFLSDVDDSELPPGVDGSEFPLGVDDSDEPPRS